MRKVWGHFCIEVGWFKGEPVAFVEIKIMKDDSNYGGFTIFAIQIAKFVFALYWE